MADSRLYHRQDRSVRPTRIRICWFQDSHHTGAPASSNDSKPEPSPPRGKRYTTPPHMLQGFAERARAGVSAHVNVRCCAGGRENQGEGIGGP